MTAIVHYLRNVRLRDGGVVRAVLDTCSLLASRGNPVTLLTTDPCDIPQEWRIAESNVPVVITVSPPSVIAGATAEVDSVFRNTCVLHLHGPWDLTNVALARQATKRGIPYVVSLHGMLDDWSLSQKWLKKRLYLRMIGQRFLASAARIHCTAIAEQSQAARLLRPGSGIIIPYPVDLSPYADNRGRMAGEIDGMSSGITPRVLFLSRLHIKKRPDLLIEAAHQLQKSGVDCEVILAGPCEPKYLAELKQLASRHGIEEKISFPGMIVGEEKSALFRSADVFVLPTSQENFGIVLIEALASGVPVITTRGVDIWQELSDAGATIVEQDAAQVAEALHGILSDRKAARRLGERGRNWVFQFLDPQSVIRQYEEMYKECLENATVR
jgi:glycosyltransferase involved in cell wall biosynthesis